ncbi:hypothetical protein PPYR_06361 [Photinus pyralis]|uniref:Uncharacterized protein n=1 Tax=Photinus pyralis TaxID=7054 RepID=A0A1Y1KY21_PHOPY|nr:uncharacterized protein LOC116166340 [Photinus pyralis]KAB0800621.1 hypothetical protein PPYR_06361 [Photinus pyralis]
MFSQKRGIGDQLGETVDNKIALEPQPKRRIEKKSRLTDLLKNSPDVISEYLMVDEKSKQRQAELEEGEETLIQTIDLENAHQENVIHMPIEDAMEVIDLGAKPNPDEELQFVAADKKEVEESKRGQEDDTLGKNKLWTWFTKWCVCAGKSNNETV